MYPPWKADVVSREDHPGQRNSRFKGSDSFRIMEFKGSDSFRIKEFKGSDSFRIKESDPLEPRSLTPLN
jgi:hypothetical protein